MHLVGDRAVAGVALAAGAQLDQLHRLARVEVEHVADAVAERQRVERLALAPGGDQALPLLARDLQAAAERLADPGRVQLFGHFGAEVRAQALPLDREHAVALQVAEGAVVADDLEAVAQRLEAAAGAVAAVAALADEVGQHLRALVGPQRRQPQAGVLLADPGGLEEEGGQQRLLVAVDVQQAHRGPVDGGGHRRVVQAQPPRPAGGGGVAALQVGDPLAAAVGARDARDEAGHDRLDRGQDALPAAARLGQRVGEQVQDQLLVGLAGGVDAHVRQRGGGQQPAQQVERLGVDRARARRRGGAGEALVDPGGDLRQRL